MILSRYLTKEIFKKPAGYFVYSLTHVFSQQLISVLNSVVSGKIPTDLVLSLLGLYAGIITIYAPTFLV